MPEGHPGPHGFGQGPIDWEAAERAAIQAEGEEPTTETEAAAAAAIPDAERPTVAVPAAAPPAAQAAKEPEVQAPVVVKTRLQSMREMLEKALPRVMNVIPRGISIERLFAVAYVAIERTPTLLECTAISVLRTIIAGAQLGLDVSGIGSMAYMVPFRNKKTNQREATLIIGYRGLIELARRSGAVAWISPGIVCAGDPHFEYIVDPLPRLTHKPLPADRSARGPVVGAYSVATFTDPRIAPFPWVISRQEIDAAQARSQTGGAKEPFGPWVTDHDAMCMKTAIRAHSKYLPWSPDLSRAVDIEEQAEAGEGFKLEGELPEVAEEIPTEAPRSASAAIAKKLGGKRSKK